MLAIQKAALRMILWPIDMILSEPLRQIHKVSVSDAVAVCYRQAWLIFASMAVHLAVTAIYV